MKKRINLKVMLMAFTIFILIMLVFIIFNQPRMKFTAYAIQKPQKLVQFYFYDEKTNCPLEGYLFIGENLVGKTIKGSFNLSYDIYKLYKGNVSLFGGLGECFNSNLLFDEYWELGEIQESYFDKNSIFNFKASIYPNNPQKRALSGFIQPEKLKQEIAQVNPNNNEVLEDFSLINDYLNRKIKYVKDWDYNKEDNYWQTPLQTLSLEQGDCEDYSVALLSLFLAYNESLNCYNIVFSGHVTTFCKINNYYAYYDQQKTELKREITYRTSEEKKIALEKLKNQYFEHYGLNETENAYFAFNENTFAEFKDNDAFISWQASLNDKKIFNLLEIIEQEYNSIKKNDDKESGNASSELPSYSLNVPNAPASSPLASEKPTFVGFVQEYYFLFISSTILIIILILILIKLNKE
jgi:uncharacterized integral membrane protein